MKVKEIVKNTAIALGLAIGISSPATIPMSLDYLINGPYKRTALEEINPPNWFEGITGPWNDSQYKDNKPRVFDYKNKDRIIIRTPTNPKYWLGVDLIGSRKNGFEYAIIPAPVRGVGRIGVSSPDSAFWEECKYMYEGYFEIYENQKD